MSELVTGSAPAPRRRRTAAAFAGTLAVVALLAINESADPDLGFHLATGRAVLETGAIPATNVLSYAEPEHEWINQQWLPATAFALAYQAEGFAGTLALRVVLVLLTAGFVLAAARRLGATPEIAAAFTLLGAWAAAVRFVERPLLASNLALAVVVWACAGAAAEARDGRARRALGWVALAGLTASLAVHLHAGAIFSFLALGAFATALALEPTLARPLGRAPMLDAVTARRGAVALAVSAAAGVGLAGVTLALYHPHGLRVLTFPLEMASDAYLAEHLVEFRSPIAQPLRLMAPYWALLATALVVVAGSWRRASVPLLVAIALGVAISLRHARFVDLAWIFLAPPLAALSSEAPVLRPPARAAGLAVALALGAALDRTSISPPAIGASPAVWPTSLFDVLPTEGLVGPAFVHDGWAGPFLARFWPRERVFFHPAFEAYSPEHVRLYQSIRYGEPGWESALDAYGVQLVVMKYTSPRERAFQDGGPNLRQGLASSPAWALVAFDDRGEIFVRREGPNAAVAARAPSFVDPDALAFSTRPRETRDGLEFVATRSPRSMRVVALLAIARADAGDREGALTLLAEADRDAPGDPTLALARRALDRIP